LIAIVSIPQARKTFAIAHVSLAIFVACAAFACPVECQADTLFGGLQHSEKLAPVQEQYSAGRAFSDKKLGTQSENEDWFKIPKWLAGKWLTIDEVRTYLYDQSSGNEDSTPTKLKSREKETFGWQDDNRGDIWTTKYPFSFLEQSTESERAATPSIQITSDKQDGENSSAVIPAKVFVLRENIPVLVEQERVQLKSLDTVIRTNRENSKVLSSEKAEIIRRFVPIDSDILAVTSDIQYYDRAGFPTRRQKIVSLLKRVGNYARTDELSGRSLQASFSKYLQGSGNIELIPSK
jgi:hypothetical protein